MFVVQHPVRFSALQRAEIAEIVWAALLVDMPMSFSALQRAEIAEIYNIDKLVADLRRFSALQRAEIAEMLRTASTAYRSSKVSVLFNEPKLLKFTNRTVR